MGRVKIVSASAGSGKTYNLAYQYVRIVVGNPELYRHILAVTFTNKATDEMKRRILSQLDSLAEGMNQDFSERLQNDTSLPENMIRQRAETARNYILHNYSNFSVMTIDKFFQRILRAFIKELGIDINFNLELQTDTLLGRSADKLIEDLTVDRRLREWLIAYMGENIESGSSWDIRRNLTDIGGQIFGERYAEIELTSDDKPELQKAAYSARQRADRAIDRYVTEARRFVALMDDNGLVSSDFAYGDKGVAGYITRAADGSIVRGGSRVDNAIKGAWHTAHSPKSAEIDRLAPELTEILIAMQPLLQEAITLNATAKIITGGYRAFALMADLKERMTAICREDEIIPMAEIGGIIARLVSDNDAPFIYEKSGNRYSYYMIDEVQDTSLRQWNNFVPLLQNALAQSSGEPVMIVGDVKQSIYRWRGGDWRLLAGDAARGFDESRSVTLTDNYRSFRNVVEFNNDLIGNSLKGIKATLGTALRKGVENGALTTERSVGLLAMVDEAYSDYRQSPANTKDRGCVTFQSYDPSSPHPVVACVEDLQSRGYRPSDIAILVRRNTEAAAVAAILLEHKRQNPDSPYSFDVITQEALIVASSDAVRFTVASMALAINRSDTISLAIYNGYLGRMPDTELSDQEAQTLGHIAFRTPEEAFEEIVIDRRLDNLTDEIPYLQALHQLIIDFCKTRIADIGLFLKYWDEECSKKTIPMPQNGNAITIMTIHKAKGLGFRTVILPYCSWALRPRHDTTVWATPRGDHDRTVDLFPARFSDMPDSLFSEAYYQELTMGFIDSMNELYVAVTRAAEELHIMMPENSIGANDSIAGIVADAVSVIGGKTENGRVIFGTPVEPERIAPVNIEPSSFGTFRPSEKIAVRFAHERYDEDGTKAISPREMGILMHRAMENAENSDDITVAVDRMVVDAGLSQKEAAELRRSFDDAFMNPTVAGWFDGHWQSVRNENEIVSKGRTFRPDRVMISPDKTVVVDYKFGLPSSKHAAQVGIYLSLLKDMGYKSVEGYVWYVTSGRVVQV